MKNISSSADVGLVQSSTDSTVLDPPVNENFENSLPHLADSIISSGEESSTKTGAGNLAGDENDVAESNELAKLSEESRDSIANIVEEVKKGLNENDDLSEVIKSWAEDEVEMLAFYSAAPQFVAKAILRNKKYRDLEKSIVDLNNKMAAEVAKGVANSLKQLKNKNYTDMNFNLASMGSSDSNLSPTIAKILERNGND